MVAKARSVYKNVLSSQMSTEGSRDGHQPCRILLASTLHTSVNRAPARHVTMYHVIRRTLSAADGRSWYKTRPVRPPRQGIGCVFVVGRIGQTDLTVTGGFISALHGMLARTSDQQGVRLSVRPFVC